jgi:hypothetical protein
MSHGAALYDASTRPQAKTLAIGDPARDKQARGSAAQRFASNHPRPLRRAGVYADADAHCDLVVSEWLQRRGAWDLRLMTVAGCYVLAAICRLAVDSTNRRSES